MAELTQQEEFEQSLRRPAPNSLPEDLRAMYRLIYEGDVGREVLAHRLDVLGMFYKIKPGDDEAIGRHNAAVDLLMAMGVISPGCMRRIVDGLLTVPLENKEK